ncbi:MAG: tRNA dihydrouridine synthase DusB [Clostridia bacterium]|nr:tRNA dihydrouridine synthase DusB [Clostridia bacterium]
MNIFGKFKEPPLILAPMAGIADNAFRLLCKKHGADIVYSEMISSKAVYFNDKKTYELAKFEEAERPLILQIFGSEPEIMAYAAKKLYEFCKPDGIDINMGCPVHKIVSGGDGSALMKSPFLVYEIVARVREAVPSEVPVSVKIRKGMDDGNINFCEVALKAQEGGCDFIALHGRTRAQMYSGKADLEAVKTLKETLSVPLVGNGDVTSPESYDNMIKTGCDAVMIGRGSYGNPFIFNNLKRYRDGLDTVVPDRDTVKATIFEQLELSMKFKPEDIAIRESRKHISYYLKGFHGSAALRDAVNRADTKERLYEILNTF